MRKVLTVVFIITAVLSSFLVRQACAEEKELDLLDLDMEELLRVEVVSSASKYEQNMSEAPSSVTIITRRQIELLGYRTFSELIRGVRGFYSTNDRNYSYTGVRGFGRPADFDTRLLVLLDGHRLNENVYESAVLGLDFMIDLDLVERIEIVRGPSSSLYGTNAFFGVINVITRSGAEVHGIEVSAQAGSFDNRQGRVTFGNKYENGAEVLLSGTGFDNDGQSSLYFSEFDTPETNNGVAENRDQENGRSFFGKISWEGWSLKAGMVDREKGIPTAPYGIIFNDPSTKSTDTRSFIDLNYIAALTESVQFSTRAFHDWYDYQGDYPYDYAEEGDDKPLVVINRDDSIGRQWGLQSEVITTAVESNKIV
ncbi:MAG: TonB-dependent receptor plug domain-containing protein, partial [Bdellovibrionales bacterium]|nr:TonB-dependent receptor plug domain-containing protein [Bdellovibrionales bacterium]